MLVSATMQMKLVPEWPKVLSVRQASFMRFSPSIRGNGSKPDDDSIYVQYLQTREWSQGENSCWLRQEHETEGCVDACGFVGKLGYLAGCVTLHGASGVCLCARNDHRRDVVQIYVSDTVKVVSSISFS